MRSSAPPLLPLLRSQVQGDLLALLYLRPDREYSLTEAAARIGASVKAVHQEASRLTDALAAVPGVERAFIHGSWAARYQGEPGPVPNDVDVLVIGTVDPDDLDEVARHAQRRLGRPVNIRRVRPASWRRPDPGDPFLGSVRERPLVELHLGSRGSTAT